MAMSFMIKKESGGQQVASSFVFRVDFRLTQLFTVFVPETNAFKRVELMVEGDRNFCICKWISIWSVSCQSQG